MSSRHEVVRPLKANRDKTTWLVIAQGQFIDVGPDMGDGTVRIYWEGEALGMGGLAVMRADLNECAVKAAAR
jgi:hypothetical protein